MPPPNVDSIVVKLMQRTEPLVTVDNEEAFFKLAKAAFAQRRRQLTMTIKIILKMVNNTKMILQ